MTQLLPFKLGEEIYALDVTDVQEVVEGPMIYPLPGAAAQIRGAIGFHGRILPVVDLPLLLGFAGGQRAERLLVLIEAHGPMVLAVDQLQPIIAVDLVQCTLIQSSSEEDCIRGVLNWRETMISLLNLEQLQHRVADLCSRSGG